MKYLIFLVNKIKIPINACIKIVGELLKIEIRKNSIAIKINNIINVMIHCT